MCTPSVHQLCTKCAPSVHPSKVFWAKTGWHCTRWQRKSDVFTPNKQRSQRRRRGQRLGTWGWAQMALIYPLTAAPACFTFQVSTEPSSALKQSAKKWMSDAMPEGDPKQSQLLPETYILMLPLFPIFPWGGDKGCHKFVATRFFGKFLRIK